MSDIELVIKLPECIIERANCNLPMYPTIVDIITKAIANGTPVPKGHGKIVDISKIDDDRMDSDNPVINLTICGECIEAVSLEYLNDLPPIIEADKEVEE